MKRLLIPVSLVVAAVGLQLLASQPAEARGRMHHMRDQFARQQAFYANPGRYGGGYGANCNNGMNSYGWQNRVNPQRQNFGYGYYPGHGYGYGQGGRH